MDWSVFVSGFVGGVLGTVLGLWFQHVMRWWPR